MKKYQRLPGIQNIDTANASQEHELQDLSGRPEDEEVLLSSFNGDRSPIEAQSDSQILNDNRLLRDDEQLNVLFELEASTRTRLANEPELIPELSLQSQQQHISSNNRREVQIPNTIIHRLINNPRVSRYVPHLLRNYYQPVYNGRPIGQGLNNDGVFTNMAAKPSTHQDLDENLPSYEQLAMDSTPPYWESSVISPGFEDEIFVDGLPVGSILNFVWNFIVSFSFQFIGFFLTYLLHTSHGSKEGSRAGLGLTFMNYGYGLLPVNYYNKGDSPINKFEPNDPNSIDIDGSQTLDGHFYSNSGSTADMAEDAARTDEVVKTPVFAFALIALGLFILLKSIIDYHRARQMEKQILNPNHDTGVNNATTTTNSEPEEV